MAQPKFVNEFLNVKNDEVKQGKLWAKTEVIAGHGFHPGKDRFHLSYLDEVIIGPEENMVPISGVQYLFEQVFGVKGPLTFPTAYTAHGIGVADETDCPTYIIPEPKSGDISGLSYQRDTIHPVGEFVQLLGLGITGTAENNVTLHKVGYRETDIEMVIRNADGNIDGIMLPFRYTESELDANEKRRYFGKRLDDSTGKTAYYLKRFDAWPEIKHIWRSSDQIGSKAVELEADNSTWNDDTRDDALKSLVEIHFTIDEDDLKEFFNFKLDQPESARFNTLGLFTGRYTEKGMSDADTYGDYCNVRLFSKLNIYTEPMALSKDLEFIYRVYGS